MDLEKLIEESIRAFWWDDLGSQEMADYRTEKWPAELASEIVKEMLITNLRADGGGSDPQ